MSASAFGAIATFFTNSKNCGRTPRVGVSLMGSLGDEPGRIIQVSKESVGHRAGLQVGDVLISLDDAAIDSTNALRDRPNVVYIMADDLGYGDLGCYGQTKIKTPHIDRLAKNGMKFTNFYAGSTVCAPSRCVLMTGLDTGQIAGTCQWKTSWRRSIAPMSMGRSSPTANCLTARWTRFLTRSSSNRWNALHHYRSPNATRFVSSI